VPGLIHPHLLEHLEETFFPSLATIQVVTLAINAYREPIETWADLALHVDIPCAITPASARERASADKTVAETTHTAILAGDYQTVTPVHRAVVDGTVYDIMGVEHDSHHITTRLRLKITSV